MSKRIMGNGQRAAWKSNRRKEFGSNFLFGWADKCKYAKKMAIKVLRKRNNSETIFQYKEYWEEQNERFDPIVELEKQENMLYFLMHPDDDDYDLEYYYRWMNDDEAKNLFYSDMSSYLNGEYKDPYDMDDWDIYNNDENFKFDENE